jgi:cleavage and polyadenylation specificity factor subunit 1
VVPIFDRKLLLITFAPGLPPEGSVINLSTFGIVSLLDLEFAEGYYLPTLLILHERRPTWVGYVLAPPRLSIFGLHISSVFTSRQALRRDTTAVTAVSLSLAQRQYPVIWAVDLLPYDAFKVVPVPAPVGTARPLRSTVRVSP